MAVGAHLALVAADTAQVALVQGVGVDVASGGVVDSPVDFFTAQDRQACTGFIDRQALHLFYSGLGAQVLAVEFGRVTVEIHGHFAPWRQQWVFAETCGWLVEEGPAGQRQRAYLRGAVRGGIECRRTPGGVIGRVVFTLQHQHLAVLRQPEPGGRAGNAAADNDEVCLAHEELLK